MILVRDIFNLRFGTMRDALSMWKEGEAIMRANGHKPGRILTDLTGDYYTLVMETQFNNLSEFENGSTPPAQADAWRDWYKRFSQLVESGRREIFKIVQ